MPTGLSPELRVLLNQYFTLVPFIHSDFGKVRYGRELA
jgi:hypothetical protein